MKDGDETDEFEKLRVERERERMERQNQLLVRSVSNAPATEGLSSAIGAAILTSPVPTPRQQPNVPSFNVPSNDDESSNNKLN